jgi:plastin-3
LKNGSPHLVLGLLWQIIRIGLFNQITLEHCPGLARLLHNGERIEDLVKLSPEEILLRWVNYHLQNSEIDRRCNNFHSDITDSEIYMHLIHQIAPKNAGVTLEALMESNNMNRAEIMLQQAVKIDCRSFVTAGDVVHGIHKLNLAFVANMFNKYPSLDKCKDNNIDGIEVIEENREEKTYRNWINSMGVSPYVNWLYTDLTDGRVFLQLFDIVKPGVVDWNVVHKEFSKLCEFMEKLENCNYVVKLGKKMNFSLIGISGQDINEGNVTLTLALVWQLMRAFTFSMLPTTIDLNNSYATELCLINLVNKLMRKKCSIKNFQDSSIADSKPILHLIDCLRPGLVNYHLVKEGGNTEVFIY